MAAFEAVGYAKFSGRPAVCMATSGPGAIHLLNGLYDAKLDHVPVVAIVGQTARSAMGGSYQQEVDLQSLFKDVAGAYVETAMDSSQFPNLIDRAFRIALTEHTPTCVIIPSDLQEETYTAPEHSFKQVPSSPPGYTWPVLLASVLAAAVLVVRLRNLNGATMALSAAGTQLALLFVVDIERTGGECLLDMRVRPGGSHHQKFVVLRHPGRPELDVAFVGGIDLCHSRHDDAAHAGDPNPQPMAAVYGDRPPWHDLQVSIKGPAVGDVEAVFRERWQDPTPLSRNPLHRLRALLSHEETRPRTPTSAKS